ncbi:flavin reductase [Micromonospora sp. RP3T]|nr:flavin reductase [Micromonospora sp. RP3T]
MSAHHPVKPTWTCDGCARDWPCRSRRRELRAEYNGASASLAVYLAAQFVDAVRDLGHVPTGDLYRRFLGWIR